MLPVLRGPIPPGLTSPRPTSRGHTISLSTFLMTALYMLRGDVWPPNLSFTWFVLIRGGLGSTA